MMATPILKWAGGKRQLLDELYERFPQSYNNYHEPFIGGGALFFDINPTHGTINDVNPRLVNFYRQVRDKPDELIEICQNFRHPESEPNTNKDFSEKNRKGKSVTEYYYQQRELFNNRPYGDDYDPLEEAALLLYLNRTCYNGLYRENRDGGFNSPIGRYNNPDWVRKEEVQQASQVLKNIQIFNKDFEYILSESESKDLVYIDPPYEPMSATASFNDYSAEGFGIEDQKRLLEVVTRLDNQGIHVILSNSAAMLDMYNETAFQVQLVGAKRSINSDGENRDEVDEIIATNIPMESRLGQQTLTDIQ
jgi:DNA adenine methylase